MSSPEQSLKSVTHLFNNVPGYQVNEIAVSRTQRSPTYIHLCLI